MGDREPTRYVGVKGVAAWFGLPATTVSKWLLRYAETHPTPVPDAEIEGVKGWLPGREEEWRKWDAARPGQGRGGGPRKA
jgi:hypothetical protein